METRGAKRRRLEQEEKRSKDKISNLPDVILHHILSFLPIKISAQTSLLSTRWRYIWSSIPNLDFSKICPKTTTPKGKKLPLKKIHDHQTKAMEFITTVLAHRHGSSNIKSFCVGGHLSFSCLHDTIRRLVKHSIEELELDVSIADRFNLPRCLLNCDSLRSLKLKASCPNPPPKDPCPYFVFPTSYVVVTKGLVSVHTLSLTKVHFTDTALTADLFSGSLFSLLKKLSLNNCKGMTHLNISCSELEELELCCMKINGLDISGRKLKRMDIRSCFQGCNNESWVNIFAPGLQNLYWEFNELTDKCSIPSFPSLQQSHVYLPPPSDFSAAKANSAISLVCGLSQAQHLRITFRYIEILSELHFGSGLPFSFANLMTLEIQTALNKRDIPGIACLLKNTPTLHTLIVEVFNSYHTGTNNKWKRELLDNSSCSEEQYWESQAQALRSCLDHLKVAMITVHGNLIYENAINITRFLLGHGRALQRMVLSSNHLNKATNLSLWEGNIDSIMKFPRASPDVKISHV